MALNCLTAKPEKDIWSVLLGSQPGKAGIHRRLRMQKSGGGSISCRLCCPENISVERVSVLMRATCLSGVISQGFGEHIGTLLTSVENPYSPLVNISWFLYALILLSFCHKTGHFSPSGPCFPSISSRSEWCWKQLSALFPWDDG